MPLDSSTDKCKYQKKKEQRKRRAKAANII